MIVNELMSAKNMSKYKLAQVANIPYMTVNDICNGKTRLGKCKAETIYRLAKALNMTVEDLLESDNDHRCTFDLFRSGVCHRLKELGDIEFLLQTLAGDEIREYYRKEWYPECLYLLAMTDYLCRLNQVSLCRDYDDLREKRLSEIIYPSGILAMAIAEGSEEAKEKAWNDSIPEFRRFNIVEKEVRDVV